MNGPQPLNLSIRGAGKNRVTSRHLRGASLEHGLEVGSVVADRPVPAVSPGERVAVEIGVGELGEVLADL